MKNLLKNALEQESEVDLIKYIEFIDLRKIENFHFDLIEIALVATWHNQHEDLVNIVYLNNLKDDRFVQPILNIALNRDIFRAYDDEMESTLRKCVHALKTINSKKSNEALEKLQNLNNHSIMYALEIYK